MWNDEEPWCLECGSDGLIILDGVPNGILYKCKNCEEEFVWDYTEDE